jgi:hypothetical protein
MHGPILRYAGFGIAAPGADTDIISGDLTPRSQTLKVRVLVVLAVASVFKIILTQGVTSYTAKLGQGAPLLADCAYTFDFEIDSATSYNFQVATNGAVNYLNVKEIVGEGA